MKTNIIQINSSQMKELAIAWAVSKLSPREKKEIIMEMVIARMNWIIEDWNIETVISSLSEKWKEKLLIEYITKKIDSVLQKESIRKSEKRAQIYGLWDEDWWAWESAMGFNRTRRNVYTSYWESSSMIRWE